MRVPADPLTNARETRGASLGTLPVVVVAVLLLGVAFALRNGSGPASPSITEPAQVVEANVVSPPPAAPVREVASPEPVAPRGDVEGERDWVTCRVVLVDPSGAPLPEVLHAALRGRADLHGGIGERQPATARIHTFHNGTTKLPAGDYELRLFDAGSAQMVPRTRCTVARDTAELRIPVAIADRVVRLHLRGLPGAGYMLRLVHESGRTAQESGRADAEHTLLLPPGPCIATVNRLLPDGRQELREHAFTVTEAVEQHVAWDVPAPQ